MIYLFIFYTGKMIRIKIWICVFFITCRAFRAFNDFCYILFINMFMLALMVISASLFSLQSQLLVKCKHFDYSILHDIVFTVILIVGTCTEPNGYIRTIFVDLFYVFGLWMWWNYIDGIQHIEWCILPMRLVLIANSIATIILDDRGTHTTTGHYWRL